MKGEEWVVFVGSSSRKTKKSQCIAVDDFEGRSRGEGHEWLEELASSGEGE